MICKNLVIPPLSQNPILASRANKQYNFYSTDSESAWNANLRDPGQRKKLEDYGWISHPGFTYNYNSYGFRCVDFNDELAGLAIGCSYTEGVGLPKEQTYPAILSQMLDIPVWNLGIAGSSLDTAFRTLHFWIQHLNIKFVCLLLPPVQRFDLCIANDWNTIGPHDTLNTELKSLLMYRYLNAENAELNTAQNLLAMAQLCEQRKVPFVCINPETKSLLELNCQARDLQHFGAAANAAFAKEFYQQLC